MTIELINLPVWEWYCPNCGAQDATRELRPHVRFHTCPRLRMMSAPMLRKGVKAKVEAHDRDDYVGKDIVQVDGYGRPIMSVTTTRDDGQDTIVFAPTATARA